MMLTSVISRTMLDPEQVTSVLVTKGGAEMERIVSSIPYRSVVYDNTKVLDLKVLGRYVMLSGVQTPVVYNQDDDCILASEAHKILRAHYKPGYVTGLMPRDHAMFGGHPEPYSLLGWGAVYDKELPALAFSRWLAGGGALADLLFDCDIIFSGMTPFQRVAILDEAEWHFAPERGGGGRARNGADTISPVLHLSNAFTPDRMHNNGSQSRRFLCLKQARRIMSDLTGIPNWRGDIGDDGEPGPLIIPGWPGQ